MILGKELEPVLNGIRRTADEVDVEVAAEFDDDVCAELIAGAAEVLMPAANWPKVRVGPEEIVMDARIRGAAIGEEAGQLGRETVMHTEDPAANGRAERHPAEGALKLKLVNPRQRFTVNSS